MMKLLSIVALVSVVIAAMVVITKHSDDILAAFTSWTDSSEQVSPQHRVAVYEARVTRGLLLVQCVHHLAALGVREYGLVAGGVLDD